MRLQDLRTQTFCSCAVLLHAHGHGDVGEATKGLQAPCAQLLNRNLSLGALPVSERGHVALTTHRNVSGGELDDG